MTHPALFVGAVAIAMLSGGASAQSALPDQLRDLVSKIADSGPGLTSAQKAQRQKEFDSIKTIPAAELRQGPGGRRAVEFCGRGEMRQSANRVAITGADGQIRMVRLAWVFAPEEPQRDGRGALVNGMQFADLKDLCVVVVSEQGQDDRGHRRYVGTVFNAAGQDVALELLKMGLAWHWTQYADKGQNRRAYEQYAAAQKWTRDWKVGLFADPHPIAPWTFQQPPSASRK